MVGSWIFHLGCKSHWPSHFYQMVGGSWSSWHNTLLCYNVVISNTSGELHEFGEHHLLLARPESMELYLFGFHNFALKINTGPDNWGEGLDKCIDESRPKGNGDVGEFFSVEPSQPTSPFPARMMPQLSLVIHTYTSIFHFLSNLGLIK